MLQSACYRIDCGITSMPCPPVKVSREAISKGRYGNISTEIARSVRTRTLPIVPTTERENDQSSERCGRWNSEPDCEMVEFYLLPKMIQCCICTDLFKNGRETCIGITSFCHVEERRVHQGTRGQHFSSRSSGLLLLSGTLMPTLQYTQIHSSFSLMDSQYSIILG